MHASMGVRPRLPWSRSYGDNPRATAPSAVTSLPFPHHEHRVASRTADLRTVLAHEGAQRRRTMSRPPATTLGTAAIAAVLLASVVAWVVVPGGAPPTPLDTWVFDITADWTAQAPWIVDVAAVIGEVTDIVPSTLVATAVVLALLAWRRWHLAMFVAVTGLTAVAIVEVLKRTVGRMRPPGAEAYIDSGLDRSFPSGHASLGIYVYVTCAVLVVLAGQRAGSVALEWSGRLLAVFAVTIGLTRIVLGVHWATDVLAGWAIGSSVLLVTVLLTRPDDLVLRRSLTTTGVRRPLPEEPAA